MVNKGQTFKFYFFLRDLTDTMMLRMVTLLLPRNLSSLPFL